VGEVVDRAARGCELEVQQCHRDALTEDDVLGAHVVVAHERPAGRGGDRVGQALVPGEAAEVEPAGGVVQPAQQPGDGRQRGVGLAPVGIRRDGNLTVDEHEALTPIRVDADRLGGALEPGVPHRPEEGVDRPGVRARRAQDVRTVPDDLAHVRDPALQRLLTHATTLADGLPSIEGRSQVAGCGS
jgi:hypothetical protein